jgi:hypothetical protein
MEKPPRLYIIVRSNISRSQQAIQAGHAVAKFVQHFPTLWPNRALLYLRVASEEELNNLYEELKLITKNIVLYQDPNWNSNTSIGVFGDEAVIEKVKNLSLI